MQRLITLASLAGAMSVVPAAFAAAPAKGDSAERAKPRHRHERHQGLLAQALKLDSLTQDQRTAIERLAEQRKAASAPVHATDARVLTDLAHQVEQAKIDRPALQPDVRAEENARVAEAEVDRSTLAVLHSILTSAQRAQLVDGAEHGRKKHAPWLESFRGESFDASGVRPEAKVRARFEKRTIRMESRIEGTLASMTPAQRAELAAKLRARASREESAATRRK